MFQLIRNQQNSSIALLTSLCSFFIQLLFLASPLHEKWSTVVLAFLLLPLIFGNLGHVRSLLL